MAEQRLMEAVSDDQFFEIESDDGRYASVTFEQAVLLFETTEDELNALLFADNGNRNDCYRQPDGLICVNLEQLEYEDEDRVRAWLSEQQAKHILGFTDEEFSSFLKDGPQFCRSYDGAYLVRYLTSLVPPSR